MEKCSVSTATLGRLPCYLQHLREILKNSDEYVSATTIAKSLSLGEVQVRKDLNSVSGAGRPKIGYSVKDLIKSIENALGYSNLAKAAIVGAGKLGQALLNFEGFEEYGVEISAAFDLVAKEKDELHREVYPMSQFESFCKNNNIKIGIITVNENAAQEVCDRMVENNIKAIWNFTPKKLKIPEDVLVKQENLALSIAHLNYQLVNQN
ncbi:MAG: redox-sensing transcriptional repressor Rex [Clostridia bacterium]|nr:redox-sensing transcriptional repressor Rex [Clostridia bacterium]